MKTRAFQIVCIVMGVLVLSFGAMSMMGESKTKSNTNSSYDQDW